MTHFSRIPQQHGTLRRVLQITKTLGCNSEANSKNNKCPNLRIKSRPKIPLFLLLLLQPYNHKNTEYTFQIQNALAKPPNPSLTHSFTPQLGKKYTTKHKNPNLGTQD
jgi:hypothetical protein